MQGTSSSNTAAASEPSAAPLRACSTSGCRVNKYVEVTKRKCSQFVSAPYIMPKPLVVNGKTSIFQVGGTMGKIGDISSLAAASGCGNGQPIYRIKPGTHAHVINYVFIDENSDSMAKAKSEDQETMRMLLDSQRESATAKLQKLLSTHRGAVAVPPTTNSTTNTASPAAASTGQSAPAANTVHVTTPQLHPNLSIASVEGALPKPATNTAAAAPPVPSPAPAPAPAKTPGAAPVKAPALTPATAKTKKTNDSVNQLQAEILRLRRTVARLGGARLPK